MPRFYLAISLFSEQSVELPSDVVRHINVLRLREGQKIVLFNGNGKAYTAVLRKLSKKSAQAEVIEETAADDKESCLDITLVQAVSSGERMDFTLQKSVELGIKQIIPVVSTRSIVKLDGERAEKRVMRWQEIVVSACEQCGRNVVPRVMPIMGFRQMLESLPEGGMRLLLGLNGARKLGNQIDKPKRIVFMVGPEGGWTPDEEQQALSAGFEAILLGPRILRTETAALAALAAMQTLWGDF